LRGEGTVEWRNGAPLPGPDTLMSMNAYLGATPIRAALDAGADIVVTGRCVDAATVIGVMMHAFDWADTDYDRLAQAAVAGHLVECGTQVTGGVFTDWADVPDYTEPGYPIAECAEDGSFVITKPEGTGGIVNIGTASEQLVYEIGDPSAYFLPDVTVDVTGLTFTQEGPNRVRVEGVKGRPPTATYKVCATYTDGFCSTMSLVVVGGDAPAKAARLAETVLARCRNRFRDSNLGDFTDTRLEIIGTETLFGDKARAVAPREVYLHLAVAHAEKAALSVFSREMAPMLIAGVPGVCGYAGGRPKISPVMRVFSFLIDKNRVTPAITLDGAPLATTVRADGGFDPAGLPQIPAGETLAPKPGEATVAVPLIDLAWGRSGDKGNDSNIGIIARQPAYMPVLRAALTEGLIADYFSQYVEGAVERFELPGIHALNFLLRDSLGGGGPGALRNDPQGKAYAQMLLDLPIDVPADWARGHGLNPAA
ncbi:MAG: acyclic terpene utilization AtuA family protein, partial [Alphaproteobacteria bacterium]